jgi:hypothetical protein
MIGYIKGTGVKNGLGLILNGKRETGIGLHSWLPVWSEIIYERTSSIG